jgi:hypothetical protein
MSSYSPKFLINGYKLGSEFGGKWYVAIPKQAFNKGDVTVFYDDKRLKIPTEEPPVTTREFKDKFRAGATYVLQYYVWPYQVQVSQK